MTYIDQFVKIFYENNIIIKRTLINLNKKIMRMRIQKLNLYDKKKNRISKILVKLIWDFFGKPLFSSYLPGTYWRKLFWNFWSKIGKGGK